ncbi:hypothetical protein [Maricaulis sp. CAU 1757]
MPGLIFAILVTAMVGMLALPGQALPLFAAALLVIAGTGLASLLRPRRAHAPRQR